MKLKKGQRGVKVSEQANTSEFLTFWQEESYRRTTNIREIPSGFFQTLVSTFWVVL